MPSHSLARWTGERAEALGEIEKAHAVVGGTERGRRYATQQINFAFTTLLSSHFQGLCRDLHSESVDEIVKLVPTGIRWLTRAEFMRNRSLDRGNPHPGAIGADFNRLGIDFWTEVYTSDARNERRREMLQELVEWRNSIAHQDFDAVAPGGNPILHLAKVRAWRSAVSALARTFEQTMYNYLRPILGRDPW